MLAAHEPARLIGSNRNGSQVKGAVPLANLLCRSESPYSVLIAECNTHYDMNRTGYVFTTRVQSPASARADHVLDSFRWLLRLGVLLHRVTSGGLQHPTKPAHHPSSEGLASLSFTNHIPRRIQILALAHPEYRAVAAVACEPETEVWSLHDPASPQGCPPVENTSRAPVLKAREIFSTESASRVGCMR